MSANRKRLWFRFHLLTAVLLMIMSGGMMMANTVRIRDEFTYGNTASERSDGYGFPVVWYTRERLRWGAGWSQTMQGEFHYSLHELVENIILNSAILATVALVSETLLRRRESFKP